MQWFDFFVWISFASFHFCLCVFVNQRWLEFCLQCDYDRDWKGESPPHLYGTKLSAEQVNHISQLQHYIFKLIKEEEEIYIALYNETTNPLRSSTMPVVLHRKGDGYQSLVTLNSISTTCGLPSIRYLNLQVWIDGFQVWRHTSSKCRRRLLGFAISVQKHRPMCSNLTPNLIKCVTCPMPIIIAITWWWGTGD